MFALLALLAIHVAPSEASPNDVSHAVVLKLSDAPASEVEVMLELVSPEKTWSVPVKTRGKLELTLVHPPCACSLRARATEYAEVTRTLGDETSLLLRRLPVIRGVVVDNENSAPLAGVEVSLPGTDVGTTTDARGAFRIVVPGVWPASLRVEHPLRAPAFVPVPRAVADTDLPSIRLYGGGVMQLTVAPPVGGAEAMAWELRKDDKSAALVRSGELNAGTASVRIEAIAPGAYRLLLKGSEPLQRYLGKVQIVERVTTEANVTITPLVVEGKVTFGGEPLGSASVSISPHGYAWTATMKADEQGTFSEELWQGGTYKVSVAREPLVHVWGTDRELEGDGRVRLELKIPNRRVRGRVTEARTGKAVGDARVSAKMKFGERDAIMNRDMTAADGTFEFTGVEAGTVTLAVTKPGYRAGPPISFVLGDEELEHIENLTIDEPRLRRGIVVTDARGNPLQGTWVLAPLADAPGRYAPVATTDEQGRAEIGLASPDERGVVFAIPQSGSVGYARLGGDGDVAIRVVDSAALELEVESVDGDPIARAAVMMSINGTQIPPDVIAHMAHVQGFALYTDAAGHLSYPRMPPGNYTLWPLAGREDAESPPPPVRVAVLPGRQTVVMKFKPK